MSSRRSNQRRPARRPSNSTGFDGRSDRASRDGAYTRRDSFDPSAYGRSSDSSRTPSPRSTRDDDNPYTRRVSQAEYTQRRKRAKRKRIALVAVAVVLVLCLGGAGAAFAYYQTVSNNLHQGIDDDLARTLAAAEAAHPYEGGPFYMLLMGTDGSSDREASAEYAGDQFRSDSMMVTRIDPQGKKVALVSLHRDTLVDMGEYGQQKLNAAHSIGGASYTVETVSKLAGVPITHYAEINFDGFRGFGSLCDKGLA
ncbi:LCP family protein [Gordonibacter urolithinfaciens]|uniref:LCP family protein n=1 Tax=Gordonibacter urolithinfaciens TaxID=1335613 RepID=UPI003A8E5E75